jgi:serine phosphatase RsbU (regulator of sigma subunit)/pSer/pThr/pTyr-binding forkhead associated (FHA) protein
VWGEESTTRASEKKDRFNMATLVRTQGSNQGKWVFSVDRLCVLGRHPECDICDIFADNGNVSRFHAILERSGDRFYIRDKGSRNGTFLNGKRLQERTRLGNGDRILIADVELTFLEEADQIRTVLPAAGESSISFAETTGPAVPFSTRAVITPSAGGPLPGYSDDKLRALVQMLKRLGSSLDIDTTLGELLAGLFTIFPQAERGYVAFTSEDRDDLTPRAMHSRRNDGASGMRVSRTLIRHVLSNREAVLWADQSPESVPSGTLESLEVRSLMCAPLLDGDGIPFGVVQIDTDHPLRKYTSEDLEVMVGAVSQAAFAVRFAKLHEEALRRRVVERDLEFARRVQLGLLPESYPNCEGFEFFAYYRAAYDVGGDYYDFIELPNDRLALVVADAAGKGVAAALMMAKLTGELKYHLSCHEPGAALKLMNDSLCHGNTGQFVTLLAVILERRSGMLTIVNAGHPAPLRRLCDGTVDVVGESSRSPALGLFPGSRYPEVRTAIEQGEIWLAYTDGFTEASNATGEMFGAGRLREGFRRVPAVIREAGDRIVREVMSFLGDQPQSDDMCLLGWSRPTGSIERTREYGRAVTGITRKL